MKKEIILFIALQLIFIIKGVACSCDRKEITQERYNYYSLIFIGRVLEETTYDDENFQWVEFEVIEVLKGQTTKITKGKNLFTTCSFTFVPGHEWIIYSNPHYGLINDQYACGQSTLLKFESRRDISGDDGYISRQEWTEELNFLKLRKNQKDRMVSFHLIRFMPVLQYMLLIIGFVFLFFISEKIALFSPSILPSAIIAGSIGAVFLYFVLVPSVSDHDENAFIMMHLTFASFVILANLLYGKWYKCKLTYLKSFILSYITYLIIIGVAFTLIFEYRVSWVKTQPMLGQVILWFLPVGIPFSGIIALFFSEAFRKLLNKKAAL